MISANWSNEGLARCLSTTINNPKNILSSDYGLNQESGEERIIALANRKRLVSDIGASRIQWMDQVHGNTVIKVDQTSETDLPEADACWTKQVGVGLAVLTADCLPVVIVSKKGDWLGVAHAGWRGLANGVLAELIHRADVEPAQLESWIGPGISKRRYEVGKEVWSVFEDIHSSSVGLKTGGSRNKRLLDISSIAASQLLANGVRRVYQSGICTYDDPRFFSVRKNNNSSGLFVDGRLATVALLTRTME